MGAQQQPKQPYPYRVTQAIRKAFALTDQPATLFGGFSGYLRHADPTTIPKSALTWPSQNCTIPMKDRIVPRGGSTLLGEAFTANQFWPVIGHKKSFTTMGGINVEVRVSKSNDGNLLDIIEVLYPNPLTGIPQWYQISTGLWGVIASTLSAWNVVPAGLHRYYMDDWFDTNLNPAKSLNVSRLVWTNGLSYIFSWIGAIAPIVDVSGSIGSNYYLTTSFGTVVFEPLFAGAYTTGEVITGGTSGATAVVHSFAIVDSKSTLETIRNSPTNFIPGETLTGGTSGYTSLVTSYTPPENTWGSLGFVDPSISGESPYVNINGTPYVVVSGWGTNTIDTVNPFNPTVNVGDIAFSYPRADATSTPMDVCRGNQGYMYYGWWKSRRFFQSNAFGHDASASITNTTAILNDLVVSLPVGTGSHVFRILITSAGTPDQFQWQFDGGAPVATGVAITGAAQTLTAPGGHTVTIQFGATTGHTVGDEWDIEVDQAVTNAWTNFYYTLPVRKPGEGYIYQLPSNFWTMEPQEAQMYVNTTYGEWGYIETKLSSNLQSESATYIPLKQVASSKVIFPYMIGHTDNSLIYITENKKLDQISRQKFLELPQIGNLSNLVQKDFDECDFENGSMEYYDKKVLMNSPNQRKMLVYDNLQKYWQPPQVIPENGILSVIENQLITHSSIRNQTFNIWVEDTENGDNGSVYTVIARTAYASDGGRWGNSFSTFSFIEGYVDNKPPMDMNIYLDINGASGIRSHRVKPVIQAPSTRGPLGEEYNGEDQLGSSDYVPSPHFFELDKSSKPLKMTYHFLAMEMVCTTKYHSYEWLTLGVNRVVDNKGNNDLIPKTEVSRN